MKTEALILDQVLDRWCKEIKLSREAQTLTEKTLLNTSLLKLSEDEKRQINAFNAHLARIEELKSHA